MDANKILWNSVTIRVPQTMFNVTPTGRIRLQNSLTKLNNVSKRRRIPSINLVRPKESAQSRGISSCAFSSE